MARKKKEPINVTPPPAPQHFVKSERVKVVVMFNGDNVYVIYKRQLIKILVQDKHTL